MKRYGQKTKFLAFGLALLLAAGTAGPVYGAEKAETSVSKEETVYVMAKEDGSADQIIVSEWLKNAGKRDLIEDYTLLKDIENVKGEETFDQKNGSGTWKAGGSDIYYQGEISKELPVEMKITYKLDGKEVSAKELAGKSGKVTIRFDYTNNQKQDGVYVPFVLLTSLSLDNEICGNVEVENGKVINDGQKSMVVGYALPGLSESLELENTEIAIPDYVKVTCEAEKFEMGGTMTVATSSLLKDLDLGSINSMDDLEKAMDQLQSAAGELQDGSVKLQEGADKLSSGTGDLYKGSKTLKEKLAQLGSGLKEARTGTAQLKKGADQLREGSGQLQTGAKALQDGIKQAADGVDSAVSGLEKTAAGDKQVLAGLEQLQAQSAALGLNDQQKAILDKAINDLKAGLNQTIAGQEAVSKGLSEGKSGMSQLQEGAGSLASGAADLNTGLTSLSSGAADLNTGITAACKGAGLLEDGAGDLSDGAKALDDGAGTLASGTRDLASGIAKFKSDGIDKLAEAFQGDLSKITDRLKALQKASEDYQSFAGKKAGTEGSVKFIYKTDEI
ncbi:hypothetical protein LI177_11555 [bacterium 210820-DFI.6.37]|nr:hypothetical protein [bacterium 210820-DFI.6.37]